MASQHEQKVKYWGGQHKDVLKRHGARTADDCAAFLYPYLNKLPSDFKFLDLGCGPGSITTDLAQKYPRAHFTGVDTGPLAISAAQALAEDRKTPNTTFLVGDILSLPASIAAGTYDVVYCHQVLVHMADPTAGLRVMKSAAKAEGGLVAARESFRAGLSYWPAMEELQLWVNVMMDQIESHGNDSRTGQRLIGLAMGAGWGRDQIFHTLGSNSCSSPEHRKTFYETSMGPVLDPESESRKKLLESGQVDAAVLEKIAAAFKKWSEMDDAWAGFLNGEIVCRNG